MSDASLLIKVGADTKDAQSGIDDVKKKLASLYAQLDAAKGRQDKLIDPGNIREAGTEISKITKQIDSLNGNQGFENLGKDAGKTLGPLNEVFSSVRKIAYILPGIGIAGIFGLVFEGAAKAVEALGLFDKAVETSGDILDETRKKTDKSVSQFFSLQENVQLAKKGFLDKAEVLKEYNDTIGKTTGNVNSLDEAEKALAKNANAYIQFTLLKAAANIAYGKAADAAFQAALDGQKKATEFQTIGTNASVFGQGQVTAPGFVPALSDPLIGTAARQQAAKKAQDEAVANANKTKDSLLAIGKEFQDQAAQIAKDNNFDFFGGKETAKTQKIQDENLAYLEKVKTLTESLSKKDDSPLFKKFAESADGALGGLNFSIYQEHLKKATQDALKGAITDDTFTKYAVALKKAFDKTANPDLKIPINFDLGQETETESTEEIDKAISNIGKHMKPLPLHLVIGGIDQDVFAKRLLEAQKFAKLLNNTVNSGITDSIGGAFDAIGTAIGSGKNVFESAGKALLEGIGSLIEQLGKALLEYGIVKTAIDLFGENIEIPGGVAIAAGAAAIAAGALVKTASHAHAFAEGGIVTGPVMGLVGEAGPEAIIPLSKMDKVLSQTQGAAHMTVDFRGRLQGNDIRLSQERTARTQGMV